MCLTTVDGRPLATPAVVSPEPFGWVDFRCYELLGQTLHLIHRGSELREADTGGIVAESPHGHPQ
jgi:hypothetical protein